MARLIAAAGSAFLLAVLWMDLMFDVQVLRSSAGADEVASVAAYYLRVTTDAMPMGLLVVVAMLATVGGAVVQVRRAGGSRRPPMLRLLLCLAPITLALAHTLPAAMRLGADGHAPEVSMALARTVAHDHVLAFASMLAFLISQLWPTRQAS